MRVKSGSIFYNGRRVATMQTVSYKINTNDNQEASDGGWHNTDGIVNAEVSCSTIVPVKGVGVSVVKDAVEHRDVDLTMGVIDGKIHELKGCRNRMCSFEGEVQNGTLKGSFEWFCPAPKITG